MLSVIVPYVREYPQVVFTLRSIHEELIDIDHEVIAVDNLMPKMEKDRGTPLVKSMAKQWEEAGDPWLKYYAYDKELSHWQCKNFAMSMARGDVYWFVDSHCIVAKDTASKMYRYYLSAWPQLNGSIHLPLTYHILEPRQLIYRMILDKATGVYHYKFKTYTSDSVFNSAFEVPVMSTCGMMIHKQLVDRIGHWPKELGIYGGGENFINFTMAVMGMKKYIWPGKSLCHHGEERGYKWGYRDYHRNRTIASYIFGGRELMELYLRHNVNISLPDKRAISRDIELTCVDRRNYVKSNQVVDIDTWAKQWEETDLCQRVEKIKN